MAKRDDEVGLPLPPKPAALPEPHVHPPMSPTRAPDGPPEPPSFPPDFRSRPVDASDAPPEDDWRGRMPHGPPPPPVSTAGYRFAAFAIGGAMIAFFGIVAFLLLKPTPPEAAQGASGPEQTIELPPGQRLIHAEIGRHGEVYYRYAPLQAGEQPRRSTFEGRSNIGTPLVTIHFIERAAE